MNQITLPHTKLILLGFTLNLKTVQTVLLKQNVPYYTITQHETFHTHKLYHHRRTHTDSTLLQNPSFALYSWWSDWPV
ncbi:hypothetical protein AQUCO_01700160v1 [Aquilegia coerulea]|uniref:Uncharacterized protein n=1 Tax=Aquilegia coerulea TaxID=218851 RepID=A0A2G5DLH5_AQUCA|nr:hypothetical protein AQUCO_01700160v1 [Aquilegia coerulea]